MDATLYLLVALALVFVAALVLQFGGEVKDSIPDKLIKYLSFLSVAIGLVAIILASIH